MTGISLSVLQGHSLILAMDASACTHKIQTGNKQVKLAGSKHSVFPFGMFSTEMLSLWISCWFGCWCRLRLVPLILHRGTEEMLR